MSRGADRPPEPTWLTRLRLEMVEITTAAARKLWPGPDPDALPYFNYRLQHVHQVERHALRLLDTHGGHTDIVLAGVWIHDRFKPQFDGPNHGELADRWLRDRITGYGFPAHKVETLSFAVANHVGYFAPHDRIPPEAVEARILWDADKLDKFGLHVITYNLMAWASRPNQPLTHAAAAQPVRPLPTDQRLRDYFFFDDSYEFALPCLQAQRRYYADLARELGA